MNDTIDRVGDGDAGLSTPAAIRSYLYGLLGECFGYPDETFAESVRSGLLRRRFDHLFSLLDPALPVSSDLDPLHDPAASLESLAVEYTRLFDAGVHGGGCCLNGGVQLGPQMKVMEEVVRYYNHFGLTVTDDNRELPDHLTAELNFLHVLAYGEHRLMLEGASAVGYQRAQRDFIARHPGRWLAVMWPKFERMAPMPVFRAMVQVLMRLLTREQARLEALHGEASLKPSENLPFGGI